MTDLEKLAKQIFKECEKDDEPITMEEATEMAQMEINAKGFKHEAKSTENKPKAPKKPKTIKVSDEKIALFNLIWEGLSNYYENCTISIQNKAIDLVINDKKFTVNLVEHRS